MCQLGPTPDPERGNGQPDERAAFYKLLQALGKALEGWTLPDGARKQLETAYWQASATAPQATVKGDEREVHLDLLQEVLEVKEVMLKAGCKQAPFGEMFAEYVHEAVPQASATLTDEQIKEIASDIWCEDGEIANYDIIKFARTLFAAAQRDNP